MKKYSVLFLLVLVAVTVAAYPVTAQPAPVVAPTPAPSCVFGVATVDAVCKIEGYDYNTGRWIVKFYIYKGEFSANVNLGALVTASEMTGVGYSAGVINPNDVNNPNDDVVAIWVELAPNTNIFWDQFLAARK